MKVFTVWLNLVTKTGSTFQVPVRTVESEELAKREVQSSQTNIGIVSKARLYMPMPGGELDDMNLTFGAVLEELGIKSFGHSISWTETSIVETLEAPKVKLH